MSARPLPRPCRQTVTVVLNVSPTFYRRAAWFARRLNYPSVELVIQHASADMLTLLKGQSVTPRLGTPDDYAIAPS